jgi:hypothetical protein
MSVILILLEGEGRSSSNTRFSLGLQRQSCRVGQSNSLRDGIPGQLSGKDCRPSVCLEFLFTKVSMHE